MDRFIDNMLKDDYISDDDLKSNMDRFIAKERGRKCCWKGI